MSPPPPPRPAGVTFPSGEMQRRLVSRLYEEAHIRPEEVEYIEAHGTGTKVETAASHTHTSTHAHTHTHTYKHTCTHTHTHAHCTHWALLLVKLCNGIAV